MRVHNGAAGDMLDAGAGRGCVRSAWEAEVARGGEEGEEGKMGN